MIKRFSFTIFVIMIGMTSLFAQNQKDFSKDQRVLITIGQYPVTVAEYMDIYTKNNVGDNIIDKKTPEEYLNLYIDFKLKVLEAEKQKLDTMATFLREFEGYRKQLLAPYFTADEVEKQLEEEAYNHLKEDIRASHILVLCDEFAAPEDTLIAWKKMEKIYKRVLKGEDFNKVAWETSEDPSARDREEQGQRPAMKGNSGDLGYFSAFNMIYPFEKAAYSTPLNKVSPIFRTSIGYHIIKVTDRRSAMGKATVAHIFFRLDPKYSEIQQDSILSRANEAYQKLQNGEKWSTVLKMSDDLNSKTEDGILPAFTVNRMVPEFIVAVRSIPAVGNYSQPIKTSFGYHIIRLDKIDPVATFETLQKDIKKRIENDSRGNLLKEHILNNIKNEYGYVEQPNNLQKFLTVCDTVSFNEGKWSASAADKLTFNMFQLGETEFTVQNFAKYVEKKQTPHLGGFKKDMIAKINRYYQAWKDEAIKDYAEKHLGDKYPEYKYLLQEYRDGMLLFEIMEKEVWNKSLEDTTGVNNYFESHRNQYMWGERRDYTEMTFTGYKDDKTAKKELSKISKYIKKGVSNIEIKEKMDELGVKSKFNTKKVEKGTNSTVDSLWNEPVGHIAVLQCNANKIHLFTINAQLKPEQKELKYVRGIVTTAYQNILEKEWLEALHNKYSIRINQEALKDIKN